VNRTFTADPHNNSWGSRDCDLLDLAFNNSSVGRPARPLLPRRWAELPWSTLLILGLQGYGTGVDEAANNDPSITPTITVTDTMAFTVADSQDIWGVVPSGNDVALAQGGSGAMALDICVGAAVSGAIPATRRTSTSPKCSL
jgi:hypothetical protein